jgi:hypothetical protein
MLGMNHFQLRRNHPCGGAAAIVGAVEVMDMAELRFIRPGANRD